MTTNTETWEQRRDREKAEAIARTKALFEYATEIADYLGGGWLLQPVPNDPDREFEHSHPHFRNAFSGAEFWIGLDWRKKDRVDVHANWPKDANGREQRPHFSDYSEFGAAAPSITFARSKPAKQAAKDIERRFLSEFLPLWAKQEQVVQRQDDYRSNRQLLAGSIAALLGGEVRKGSNGDGHATVSLRNYDHGVTDVEFGSDANSLKVTVRCTFEELQKLAALFPLSKGGDE